MREVDHRTFRDIRGRQGVRGCGLEPNRAHLPHRAWCLSPLLVVFWGTCALAAAATAAGVLCCPHSSQELHQSEVLY